MPPRYVVRLNIRTGSGPGIVSGRVEIDVLRFEPEEVARRLTAQDGLELCTREYLSGYFILTYGNFFEDIK